MFLFANLRISNHSPKHQPTNFLKQQEPQINNLDNFLL